MKIFGQFFAHVAQPLDNELPEVAGLIVRNFAKSAPDAGDVSRHNNTVFSEHAGSREHDVGIIIERGVDMLVAHNTVFMSHPDAYGSGIEYRFGETSNVTLHGNLSNRDIRARDGAQADLVGNVVGGDGTWFVDPDVGDLHMVDCTPLDTVGLHPEVPADIDGTPREATTLVGADVCE